MTTKSNPAALTSDTGGRNTRRARGFITAAAVAGVSLALFATPASAATPFHARGFQAVTYNYTGAPITVTVPAGVQGVSFSAVGGSGAGAATRGTSPTPGNAANVGGYALVKQGDTVTIGVGQQGQPGGQGGWSATAPGGTAGSASGGGGGGASSIAIDGSTIAIAGGGGGSGSYGQGSGTNGSSMRGGIGGTAGSTPGNGGSGVNYAAKGGGPAGGTGGQAPTAAGATGAAPSNSKYSGGVNGSGGGGGGGVAGGAGGASGPTSSKGSGGGGGGSGSSIVASAVYASSVATASTTGNGSVLIGWQNGSSIVLTTSTTTTTTTASTTPLAFTIHGFDFAGNALGDVSKYVTLSSQYTGDVITGSAVEMTGAGYHQITAAWIGSPNVSATVGILVNPASPTQIVIQGNPSAVPTGSALPLGAATADQFGNTITDVTSTATFSSNIDTDTWQGATVIMTALGAHVISAAVPGYALTSATIEVTALTQSAPPARCHQYRHRVCRQG